MRNSDAQAPITVTDSDEINAFALRMYKSGDDPSAFISFFEKVLGKKKPGVLAN